MVLDAQFSSQTRLRHFQNKPEQRIHHSIEFFAAFGAMAKATASQAGLEKKVMVSVDIIEYHSALYYGDAYLQDSGAILDGVQAANPGAIMPSGGSALDTQEQVTEGFQGTHAFVHVYYGDAKACVDTGTLTRPIKGSKVS